MRIRDAIGCIFGRKCTVVGRRKAFVYDPEMSDPMGYVGGWPTTPGKSQAPLPHVAIVETRLRGKVAAMDAEIRTALAEGQRVEVWDPKGGMEIGPRTPGKSSAWPQTPPFRFMTGPAVYRELDRIRHELRAMADQLVEWAATNQRAADKLHGNREAIRPRNLAVEQRNYAAWIRRILDGEL